VAVLAISGEQPCPALLRDLPMLWTVGISPRGEGLTGRGNLFPLPCLQRSTHLASRCRLFCEGYPYTSAGSPHPTCAFGRRIPGYLAGIPHPARAFGAPPPPPPGGGVRAWRYQVSSRIRGAAGGPPYPVLLRDLSMCWTVWISPRGVGPTGRGNSFPLPCLLRSKYLISPAPPTPPAPPALLPRPLPGAGSVRGDTW